MSLHQQIRAKLDNPGFPDLHFFSQEDTLDASLEVLRDLLQEEKKDFADLIAKPLDEVIFDDIEDDSLLDYFWSILNHLESVSSQEKTRQIIETFMPELQDFTNEIAYSKAYFKILKYLQAHHDLDSEQQRILELSIQAYKDRGIDLSEDQQKRVKDLNKKLAKCSEKFTHNIVDEEKIFSYTVTNKADIEEVPAQILEKAEKDGKWIFDADPTTYQAIMKYAPSKKVRQEMEQARFTTCSHGKYDNRQVVLDILNYSDEKAKIMGYKTAADMLLKSKMADSPKQIFDLIKGISQKAKQKVEKEQDEMKTYFGLDTLESSDIAYYARKLEHEKYALDEQKLKEYFELENSLEYILSFVENFYNLRFKKIELQSYHEDVRVYEVWKDDELISYYFMDLFYRSDKRPGAWANNLRGKYIIKNQKSDINNENTVGKSSVAKATAPLQRSSKIPVVLNICNFMKNDTGKTTLYMRDVETIFHEFGHALHEMLSESQYSSLSGFGVEWDFVELPSQLMENWVKDTASLKKLAKHFETGEKIPDEMIDKLDTLKTCMSGHFVARQNEMTLVDMSLYSGKVPTDIEGLDREVLSLVNEYSIWHRQKGYSQYTSFGHIFGGGYAAGYYSYMWAEILEADVFARIKEMDMFSSETGKKLLDTIIAQGTRKKGGELFRDFMGREVDNAAFMKRHGLV